MSSNTQKRILSAIVLIFIVTVCLSQGIVSSLALIGIVGLICIDEIICNFFHKKRGGVNYLISQGIFLTPFVYFNFINRGSESSSVFIYTAVAMNLLLIIYLFKVKMESQCLAIFAKKNVYITGVFILLPIMSLAGFFQFDKWPQLLTVLLIINFSMDSGAWFFGKKLGKNKLWPAVSPNKTIEGLVGGIVTSGIFGGIFWHFAFGTMTVGLFFFFMFLGSMSQVGDLIQSKIKRQCNIKDSSQLIPGHGGVYDRVDSLIFLSPFFAISLKYLYF